MPPNTWKAFERFVSKYLGGTRRGADFGDATGGKNDIIHEWLSPECKYGARITYGLIQQALRQAERAATKEQLPIAIVKKKGDSNEEAVVCINIKWFRDWFL